MTPTPPLFFCLYGFVAISLPPDNGARQWLASKHGLGQVDVGIGVQSADEASAYVVDLFSLSCVRSLHRLNRSRQNIAAPFPLFRVAARFGESCNRYTDATQIVDVG